MRSLQKSQKIVVVSYSLGEVLIVVNLALLIISTVEFVSETFDSSEPYPLREERKEDIFALWPLFLFLYIVIGVLAVLKIGLNYIFFKTVKREAERLAIQQASPQDNVGEIRHENGVEIEYYSEFENHSHVVIHKLFTSSFLMSSVMSMATQMVGLLIGIILFWRAHEQLSVVITVSIQIGIALIHYVISLAIISYALVHKLFLNYQESSTFSNIKSGKEDFSYETL